MQSLRENISSVHQLLSSSHYQDFQDGAKQKIIADCLKEKGLFLQIGPQMQKMVSGVRGNINLQPTHPSLILYTAVAQALYFDESKSLEIRQELIKYLSDHFQPLYQTYQTCIAGSSK
jgi:hypothetical protein